MAGSRIAPASLRMLQTPRSIMRKNPTYLPTFVFFFGALYRLYFFVPQIAFRLRLRWGVVGLIEQIYRLVTVRITA